MYILLAVIAIIVAFVGVISLTQVTMGVGIIALACCLGIFARIVQAEEYNRTQKKN